MNESGFMKTTFLIGLFGLLLSASLMIIDVRPALAAESWERLDKKLRSQIFHLNIGVKLRLKDGPWIQIADMAPKSGYAVFATTGDARAFRVAGFGSAF